jgi:hypothetical protein
MARWIISFALIIGLTGCYYDVEEVLYPEEEGCFKDTVSYSSEIEPIISGKCYACHSIGSTISTIILEGYDNIKRYAEDGRLYGAVSHSVGFSPMPQGGAMLPECELEKINVWVQNGAPNN